MIRLFAALMATLLLLHGCVSFTVEPLPDGLTDEPPKQWSADRTRLEQLDRWQLTGKLAVRQPSDSGTALINQWRQRGNAYDIALSSSFLGMGSTRLRGTPNFIDLTLPGGDRYQSGDPESLVSAATGWQLPLGNLPQWIKGLPGKNGEARLLFDSEGKLVMIRQQGWEIRYDRWESFFTNLPPLPTRLTAVNGEKRVRLVIADWQRLDDLDP